MKYTTTLIICMACIFSAHTLNAQSIKIEGKVIVNSQETDEKSKSDLFLEGVNIVLLLQSDSSFIKGTLTDKDGYFKFPDVTKGDYLLRFSYVGYETVLISLKSLQKNMKMQNITLSKANTELTEVTVTGNPIVRKIGRMIVYPSQDAIKHSYDPYDVIGHMMIPNLHTNRVSKTLEAVGGAVQIRINGIKATQAELMAIPAKEIVRIEVIDNPGMRYGDESLGAVVDVVVKQRTFGGLVNAGASSCPYRLFGDYNFATKLNYKKSQWGLYYNNTLRDLQKRIADIDETFNLGENNAIHRIQEGVDGRKKNILQSIGLTYNYSDPESYMVNVSFQNNMNKNSRNDLLNKLYSAGSGDYIFSASDGNGWNYTPSLDILFEKKLKHEQKLQFNVIGTSISDESSRLYREYDKDQKDLVDIQSDAKSNKQSIWGEAIYDKTFKNIVLSTGVRHYQMYANAQYKGTNPITSSMRQMNSSVFFDLQGNIKSIGYLVSLGGMRSYFNERNEGHAYYLFTPSVRINFVPHKDGWMQYSFNSGSTIPSLGSLTDVEQQIDNIQIQRGNPYLKTYRTYTNSLMYTYNKPKFASILQIRHSYYDQPVMEEYFVENDRLICTEKNQQYYQSFAVNTTWMFRKIKLWELMVNTSINTNFNRYWSKGNLYNHAYSQFYLSGQLEVSYKDFTGYAVYRTNDSSLWGETISKEENRMECGVIYTHKRLQALAGILYPFVNNFRAGSERVSSVAPQIQWGRTKTLGNLVMVSIRYNFEFGRKVKDQNKKSRYNDTDSGVLKGR